MRTFIFTATFLVAGMSLFAQEKENKGRFFGGFESNSQYYLDDSKLGDFQYDNRFRSNNYLNVNYNYGKWTAGVLVEAYESEALLSYNPKYEGTNIGTFYLNYKTEKIDITAGHYYEQFGSGLLLRTWEDRALGINNALRGLRVNYRPTNSITMKALYGRQRSGFDVTKGHIFGADTEFNISPLLHLKTSDLSIGFSYVGRSEEIPSIAQPDFSKTTSGFSSRFNFFHNSFYLNGEYNYKTKDAILNVQNSISNNFVKSGNAVVLNLGYSKSGLGIDATFRRLENMGFYSERIPEVLDASTTSINYNDKILNYTPALTKQHHSNLANIYVYQAQARVDFSDLTIMKAGETGMQLDVFYKFKKGTSLGGKYGTKVAFNFSNWYNLPGTYGFYPSQYNTSFFGVADRYFTDYNFEIKKKFSKKLHSGFYYINQYYNKHLLEGGEIVKTNIVALESTYSITKKQSVRLEIEHMWADADKKNWAGGTVEYNVNNKLSFYLWDIYNYGNDDSSKQTHYYNFGGAYRKGATRIALNYGRQRGGLVCVGGVCRNVPESTGISLSVNTSF